MNRLQNHHATLVCIDGKGVLITGASGIGKTVLALHIYRRAIAANIKANIIADDQVLLSEVDGQLIGACPPSILSKVEIRGFGIADLPPLDKTNAPIDFHVALVAEAEAVQFYDGETVLLEKTSVPSLKLCNENIEAAANAILAALGMPLRV